MPRANRQSPIRSIYYDEATRTLHVAFSDGTDHTYSGVPPDVAEDFKNARRAVDVFPWAFLDAPVKRPVKRPAKRAAKRLLTLRLDPATIDGYRATGRGWQARMADTLTKGLKRQRAASPSRRSA